MLGISILLVVLAVMWSVLGWGDDVSLLEDEQVVGSVSEESGDVQVEGGAGTITADVWADNWFQLYANGALVGEDSVSIETERSFNAETFRFTASYPVQLAFMVKDFKQDDTGLEYIGTNRQQMGDGGFIAQFTDSGQVVGVTDDAVVCEVLHYAPTDKACENSDDPQDGVGVCGYRESAEPDGWYEKDFDDSGWDAASVYSEAQVSPKDGYDEIVWDGDAQLIWGDDLQQDNTLICRMILEAPSDRQVSVTATDTATLSVCPRGIDGAIVNCSDDLITIESDGLPSHELMVGIQEGGWNGQWPREQDYTGDNAFTVTRSPVLQESPQMTMKNTAGVTVNGIPVFLPQAPGRAGSDECLDIDISGDVYHEHECARDPVAAGEMDRCGGHTGRGDDYHYHAEPTCLMADLPDLAVVGYMMDGFPIYSDPIPGSRAYAACGGYVSPDGEIHYAFTSAFPYVTNCLLGKATEGPRTQGSGEYTGGIDAKNSGSITGFEMGDNGCLTMSFSSGVTVENCATGSDVTGSDQSSRQGANKPPQGEDAGEQRRYCGDGMCDNTESVESCNADCS